MDEDNHGAHLCHQCRAPSFPITLFPGFTGDPPPGEVDFNQERQGGRVVRGVEFAPGLERQAPSRLLWSHGRPPCCDTPTRPRAKRM